MPAHSYYRTQAAAADALAERLDDIDNRNMVHEVADLWRLLAASEDAAGKPTATPPPRRRPIARR